MYMPQCSAIEMKQNYVDGFWREVQRTWHPSGKPKGQYNRAARGFDGWSRTGVVQGDLVDEVFYNKGDMDINRILSIDKMQIRSAKELNFRYDEMYLPKTGDAIYSIDVQYGRLHATVGIDIVYYPNIHYKTISIVCNLPERDYHPQYFAFYEGPVIIEAIHKTKNVLPEPSLIIVDGHGLAHPRGYGLACYVGLKLDTPCIGLAKRNLLPFDKTIMNTVKHSKHFFENNNEVVGVAIRLQENINPVYISPGNKISLTTCIEIIKNLTSSFRLPDSIRRADHECRYPVKNINLD
jgi:deoxyribonuclease V